MTTAAKKTAPAKRAAAKAPQDRQQKAPSGFTFKGADGKVYGLPKISGDVASNIPGDITYNALMNPTSFAAQMRLTFATLEAVGPDEKAMEALKSLPSDEMVRIGRDWMGESQGSSD